MWTDIYFEKSVGRAELRTALAQAFGVQESAVRVTASAEDVSEDILVTAVLREMSGDFKTWAEIILRGRLERPEKLKEVEQITLEFLCPALKTRALISDDSPNPYSYILVAPGSSRQVFLDVESLDEREEIGLARHHGSLSD